jgi:hypothetical protein
MAVNCCVLPRLIEGFAGVTAMDASTGCVTVSVAVPVILLIVAPMVELPAITLVAKPPPVIVATLEGNELHITILVKFCMLPSLYVPVAVNCCVVPAAIEGFVGVTEIEARTGEVTVSVAVPRTSPKAAMIVVPPVMTPVARPVELIIATGFVAELHVTVEVTSCMLPSL